MSIIKIAGRDVGFEAPASLPIRYRNLSGRDFFTDMQNFSQSTETVEPKKKIIGKKQEAETILTEKWDITILFNIVHAMAKAADPSITSDVIEWVDSFEEFPIFEVFQELLPLVVKSMKSTKK